MLFTLNLILSMIFMFLNHPMSMGLILLSQTMIISMITGMLSMNFWFSYILFLIMIGGMLILFIYMTSIASNEMFSYSNNTFMFILTTWIIMNTIFFILDFYFMAYNDTLMENLFHYSNNYNLNKYFNYPSMIMVFFLIIYLFITLIAIVKITKIEQGPLRQMF